MRLFADRGPAGILARRLVPPLILLPILIGGIRLLGERAGFYDLAFGSAMRTVTEIALLLTIVWWAGKAINRQAKRVEEIQNDLKRIADAMPQVVWMADSSGAVEYYNERAAQLAGIHRNGDGMYEWQSGMHPDDIQAALESWKEAVSKGGVYAHEHRIQMADGSFRWHLSRAVPTQGSNGDGQKWFGTATDIHDLKTAEYALRESEQRFARFMQNLPGLAWIKDRDGRYVFANEAAQIAFGKTGAELYGKTDPEIFDPETAAGFVENDRLAFESATGRQTIEALKDDAGNVHYSLVNKFPIHVNGEPSLIGGMAIDITEQKIAQDNQEFLFRIADKIRVARKAEDLLVEISVELGKFLDLHRCLFNEIDLNADIETVHRDYSRTGESIAGRHKISDYSAVNSEAMAAGNTIVNRDSKNDPRTADLFDKTYGPNKELAYVAVPMMREARWVASLWCSDDRPRDWTVHEITLIENIAERAWAAVERLRSEMVSAKLAAVVQSSDDAIISKDLNGVITSWNRGAEKIFGYSESEVIGKPITILIPEDRLDEEPTILDRIRHGESIDHYETIRRRKDGTLLNISLTVSPIHDAEGRVIGASKIARDITESKAAEQAIEMISRMPEENPNPVMRVTPKGELLYSNPAAKPVIEYWENLFGEKLPEDFRLCVWEAFETNSKQTIDVVYDDRFLSCNLSPVKEGGYVNVYADDVTDRQTAQQAVARSEQELSDFFDNASMGLHWVGPDGTILRVNQAELDMLGYSREEYVGRDIAEFHVDKPVIADILARLSQGEVLHGYPARLRHKDGSTRDVLINSSVLFENGEFIHTRCFTHDITDLRHAQEKLRASETQLRLVTDAIPALVSYIDKHERYQFVNRQYSDWFGRPSADFLGKKVRDVVGARAYSITRPYIAAALSGKEVSFDSWLNYKAAGQRFVHVSYVPDVLQDGSVQGLFALVSDLSELKRSEDLLHASQERMRLMTESFTDYAIFSTDNEGRIDSWNPGAAVIFGYSEEEIIGQPSEILFTPEDVVKGVPLTEMRGARRNGRALDERWHVRKDGSRFFASGSMVPLYVGRVLSGYAKIAADLTERKRNAEALQRAHDQMEVRVLERTRELAEANAALRAEITERQAAEEQKIALLKRLVTSQEDERRRIARDLHDQLGQRLTALRLKIASLREVIGADRELQARTNRLQEIGELLDSEVSFLAWELRPSAIEELGLTDAIGTFAREWSRHYGIPAEFHATGMAKLKLDPEADTHLYRIAQEALNNIVKHANAKKVNILLEHTKGEVILIVEDDGKGFDRRESKRSRKSGKGLGLTGMEERASLIGGAVEVESSPGSGTTVFARIPLPSNGRK
jgi:PAS domain S-box-containing protein